MNSTWIKNFLSGIWEILEVVLIAAATVFLIRTYLVQPFVVSGASMSPTFTDGNYILIDEITYRLREPGRGEIIVLKYPQDKSLFFIKRIIGLPGERVVSQGGTIKIFNGTEQIILDETYLPPGGESNDNFDFKLEKNQYFVMGDNRYHSFDSRNWGAVSRADIIGLAKVRILPINEFHVFSAPNYQIQ